MVEWSTLSGPWRFSPDRDGGECRKRQGQKGSAVYCTLYPEQSLRASESRGWKMFSTSHLPLPPPLLLSSLMFNFYLARRWSFSQRRLEPIEICFADFELDGECLNGRINGWIWNLVCSCIGINGM